MDPTSIMQQIEDGQLDIDAALALLGGGAPAHPAPAEASAAIQRGARRSAAGKLILEDISASPPLRAAATARVRVHLSPLDGPADPLFPVHEPAPAPVPGAAAPAPQEPPLAPAPVVVSAARSAVVLSYPTDEIAVISLEDHEHHNMFSPALGEGIMDALSRVAARSTTKVVVVHGHDSWFCSGGTPQTLDAIRRGDTVFTDSPVFRSLLDCKLVTIAAMQGHALGGGLTFGLYADIVLMAEHAYYAGNFMNHGFTPGVGATFMFPRKLGPVLGTEMLYTAQRYRGGDLQARGVAVEILKGSEVIPRALAIAREIADKPSLQLRLLKERLTEEIRHGVEDAIEKELVMHQLVFRAPPSPAA